MGPVSEVTDAEVRLVRGRVGREECRRRARAPLAVLVGPSLRLSTCGVGRRSAGFVWRRLPPCRGERAVADAFPPVGGVLLSHGLSFPGCVFLCLQPEGC